MQAHPTTSLLVALLVLAPVAVASQDSEHLFSHPVTSFAYEYPGAAPLTLPQASGGKSPLAAALLNGLVLPGLGNFYAGNTGHGVRHVALAGVGFLVFGVGFVQAYEYGSDDGGGLLAAGVLIYVGNWAWSIFSGISDAKAAGNSDGPPGGAASIIQPQLVPLGPLKAVGDPSGGAPRRIGLQLLRFTF